MKTVAAKLYEGMFLVDSALAASSWQAVNDAIRSILEKVGAEIVSIDKWDERRLAYGIRGKSRGTYILTYFRVDGPKVTQIERAAQLSEQIMRLLIISVEDLEERYLTKKSPVVSEQSQAPESAQEMSIDNADKGEVLDEQVEEQNIVPTDLSVESEENKQQ